MAEVRQEVEVGVAEEIGIGEAVEVIPDMEDMEEIMGITTEEDTDRDMAVTATTMVETMGMKHMTRTTLTRVLHQEQQEAEEVALVGRQEEHHVVNLGICPIENNGTDSSCSSPPHLLLVSYT